MNRSVAIAIIALSLPAVVACDKASAPESASQEAAFTSSRGAASMSARRSPVPSRSESPAVADSIAPEAVAARSASEDVAEEVDVPAAPASQTGAQPAPAAESIAPAMIIRTGTASVEVDSLEPAIARVRQVAQRLGGFVANSSMQSGHDQERTASLELKIPAARFDDALAGLRPIGKLEASNVETEDVSEEYVDIDARMTNARRLEQRLIDLLTTRTGKLKDVLSVERELARVREEIERHEGRLRYLKSRALVSTLTVTLHEPAPIVARAEGRGPIAESFRAAWRNFVGLIAGFIAILGVLIPLGLIGLGLWWTWRRTWRKLTPRMALPTAATKLGETR